jgi:hypothetical protein
MSRNATATRTARPSAAETPDVAAPERPAPSVALDLPLVTTTIRAPHFAIPAADAVTHVAREYIPSRGTALFYTGLAGTAVIGLIPWPVAAAVGIGTALAQRDKQHQPDSETLLGIGGP